MTNPQAAAPGVAVEIEAIRELLDVIHAGRFVPLANSEGLCKSVLDNAESVLAALLAGAAGGGAIGEVRIDGSGIGAFWSVDWANGDYPPAGTLLYAHPPVPVRAPDDLRQQLGEALTEVLTDEDAAPEPDWFDSRGIDRVIDAIMPILAATPPSAVSTEPIAWRTLASEHDGWKTTYMKRVSEIWAEQGLKVHPMFDEAVGVNAARHKFWGAGEPDCPQDLKADNGELHTVHCKVCGDGWRKSKDVCLAAPVVGEVQVDAGRLKKPGGIALQQSLAMWRKRYEFLDSCPKCDMCHGDGMLFTDGRDKPTGHRTCLVCQGTGLADRAAAAKGIAEIFSAAAIASTTAPVNSGRAS